MRSVLSKQVGGLALLYGIIRKLRPQFLQVLVSLARVSGSFYTLGMYHASSTMESNMACEMSVRSDIWLFSL